MAVYTQYVGNWRGDLEYSLSYPDGINATVNALLRIDRKGTGVLSTATFYGKVGSSSGGSQYGTANGELSKSGWTESNQVRQFGSISIPIARTHEAQSFNIYGAFRYVDSSTTSNYYNTSALSVTVPAKDSYTISYNSNGGTGSIDSQTKWYGEDITLASSGFSKAGCVLDHWNTSADDSGTSYTLGQTYTGNAALSLYAIWRRKVYAKANGEWGNVESIKVKNNGEWVEPDKMYIKVSGAWTEI